MSEPGLRPRPSSSRLAGWVDPLTARARDEELCWYEDRLDPTRDPTAALVHTLRDCIAARAAIGERADALRTSFAQADPHDRYAILERHLRATVPVGVALRGDLVALRRDLDLDALLEREALGKETWGTRIEVGVRLLLGVARLDARPAEVLDASASLLEEAATRDPRLPTRRAAAEVLADLVCEVARGGGSASASTLRALLGMVRGAEDPWVRRRALGAVRGLPAETASRWLDLALEATGRDAFLVRARAVELLPDVEPALRAVRFEQCSGDPSELVRFTLADVLGRYVAAGDPVALRFAIDLVVHAPQPRVRARALAAAVAAQDGLLEEVVSAFDDVPLVASFALDAAIRIARAGLGPAVAARLRQLAKDGTPGQARRAALALRIHGLRGSEALLIADSLAALRPGETRSVDLPEGVDAMALAQALVPLAADGYGFSLEPRRGGVRVTRGDRLSPRLWRVLHELRSPAPMKRQSLTHAVGRADAGSIRVPPARLAEESATGVPGQRIHVGAQDGWAPVIPMIDDFLHALWRKEVTIVTAEGATVIRRPGRWLDRLRAAAALTWAYASYDQSRTAALGETDESLRRRYLDGLRRLGYQTGYSEPESPWSQYLGAWIGPWAFLLDSRMSTLQHLSIVVVMLLALVFGQVALVRSRVRAARQKLSLVLGGWGTRGKSGTERLKAGLLEGMGIPFVTKTTGCEAMILHGPPGGGAVELFLFRPFDKATIWEQAQVVTLAARLGARAVTWECMALNPILVHLLQHRWMLDDLSTLTNAYPDHEDIQGPTGMDVAEVISGFAPPGATVITTEVNMLPVLIEVATRSGAVVHPVSRVDRELVASDLLSRMPHVEHPANVGLAATVGTALGLSRVEAIGLMAEHVVPDLGALSVSPVTRHLGRDVSFASGMSANDTLSFRHNWNQCGFAATDSARDPDVWLITVINNREDRVARSRVFAQVVAEDAAAHRHVLIGTNVRGFMNYLDEAVASKTSRFALGDPARVDALFAHLRAVDPSALARKCGARLGATAQAIEPFCQAAEAVAVPAPRWSEALAAAEQARPAAARLEAACGAEGLAGHLVGALARHLAWRAARTAADADVRSVYADLVRASVIVVDDSHASGDQIMGIAVESAPPGTSARIMGVQNIKGTGLDFAYQWVFFRDLHKKLVGLASADREIRQSALDALDAHQFGSAIACDAALHALASFDDAALADRSRLLVARVEKRRDELLAARKGPRPKASRWKAPLDVLEQLLDPWDAIRRRHRADLVFDDLVAMRISHPRAQTLLQELTARQKGGWLVKG